MQNNEPTSYSLNRSSNNFLRSNACSMFLEQFTSSASPCAILASLSFSSLSFFSCQSKHDTITLTYKYYYNSNVYPILMVYALHFITYPVPHSIRKPSNGSYALKCEIVYFDIHLSTLDCDNELRIMNEIMSVSRTADRFFMQ